MTSKATKLYEALVFIVSFIWDYMKVFGIILLAVGIILYWQGIARQFSMFLVLIGAISFGIAEVRKR